MKKLAFGMFLASAVISASAIVAVSAYAQTATTPVLYSQNGAAVNPSGSSEPAGYYYNSSGQQIYYYGNGTYYDPSTGTYGGQAFGTAPTATVVTSSGATPVFYSQSGTAMNPGGTAIAAGYYFNSSGQQVYYYGNGTYYNMSTDTYGGQAFGTIAYAPTAPNTGAGGEAMYTLIVLFAALAVVVGGIAYMSRRPSDLRIQ